MIELQGVTKRFEGKTILDGVNFAIESPGKTAILGASGIGKTTLARMLLGLDRDYAGKITGVPQKKACVFQEDRLIRHLTAEQNVRFVRPDMDEALLREGFERLGMAGEMETPDTELSGGMKRRVSILRALLSGAELVIMDEPLKGLDEDAARRTAEYCREQLEGRTLIYITHTMEELGWMGINRTIRLERGKIE